LSKGGVTTSDVSVVTAESRVDEIARMLGGDAESATSREHARELLEVAAASAPSGQGDASMRAAAATRQRSRKRA
jgi:hypothetical protein